MSVWLPVFVLACGGPEAAPPVEPSPASVQAAAPVTREQRGVAVFTTHCATCHGPEGRGDGPTAAALDPAPQDLHLARPAHLRGIPRRTIIEDGLPGTPMIGWKAVLSPEDLDAVYAYVHSMRHGPGGGAGMGCADCAGMGGGECTECPGGR